MKSLAVRPGDIVVPPWVVDHPSFLKWLHSGVVPDDARVCYINGEVWIDNMAEQAFAHNGIKTRVAAALESLISGEDLGIYFGDGMTYTNKAEKFTSVPDGIFVSQGAIDTGRVRLSGGNAAGATHNSSASPTW